MKLVFGVEERMLGLMLEACLWDALGCRYVLCCMFCCLSSLLFAATKGFIYRLEGVRLIHK